MHVHEQCGRSARARRIDLADPKSPCTKLSFEPPTTYLAGTVGKIRPYNAPGPRAKGPGALEGQISPSRGVREEDGSSNGSFMQVLDGTVETFRLAAAASALQAALYPGIAYFHQATGPGGSAGQTSPRTGVPAVVSCSN